MLAVAAEPRYQKLVQRLNGGRLLADWLMGLFLSLVIVLPGFGFDRAMLAFLPGALSWVEQVGTSSAELVPGRLHELPSIGPAIGNFWHSLFSDASGVASHVKDDLKTVLIWLLHEIEILGIFVFEFAIGVIIAAIVLYRLDRV